MFSVFFAVVAGMIILGAIATFVMFGVHLALFAKIFQHASRQLDRQNAKCAHCGTPVPIGGECPNCGATNST